MAKNLTVMVLLAVVLTASSFGRGTRGGTGRGPLDRSRRGSLKVGDEAPDFELQRLGAKDEERVKLSSFQGKKPVVLIFGSYT